MKSAILAALILAVFALPMHHAAQLSKPITYTYNITNWYVHTYSVTNYYNVTNSWPSTLDNLWVTNVVTFSTNQIR